MTPYRRASLRVDHLIAALNRQNRRAGRVLRAIRMGRPIPRRRAVQEEMPL